MVYTTEIAGKVVIVSTVFKLQTVKAAKHTNGEVSGVRFNVCGRLI